VLDLSGSGKINF